MTSPRSTSRSGPSTAQVHSYYNNRAGRVTTNSPWKLLDYWRMTLAPDLADFVVRGS